MREIKILRIETEHRHNTISITNVLTFSYILSFTLLLLDNYRK